MTCAPAKCSRSVARCFAVGVTCGVGLSGFAGTAPAMKMEMIGSMGQYPKLSAASAKNRRAARGLVHGIWASEGRFNTVGKARRLGYRFEARDNNLGWPSIRHMRKHGAAFWGQMLQASAPQALVWWCQAWHSCTLVAEMFRAPAHAMPPTYGGLLAWHKHRKRAAWMAHVWYTHTVRTALARCVPFASLARSRGIMQAPYKPDFSLDAPCTNSRKPMSMSGM